MAAKKKGSEPKKKPSTKKSTCYNVSGDKLERKNPFCPKCGAGVFLAVHKDRKTCGKCNYMEKN